MADYNLESPAVKEILASLARHPEWPATEPSVIEQELDIPAADFYEEDDGYFMMRTDRVIEVVGAMKYLIGLGFVEGEIRTNKDMFICAGIRLTRKGREHIGSKP